MPPFQQLLFYAAGTNKHIRFDQSLYGLWVRVVLGQGCVIVKPNIVILWLIFGYGVTVDFRTKSLHMIMPFVKRVG
jgi:hypothetical protein